jgi:hypothetical protein
MAFLLRKAFISLFQSPTMAKDSAGGFATAFSAFFTTKAKGTD